MLSRAGEKGYKGGKYSLTTCHPIGELEKRLMAQFKQQAQPEHRPHSFGGSQCNTADIGSVRPSGK